MIDNSESVNPINSWRFSIIDEIKSPGRNGIAMGPFGSNIKKENFRNYGVPVIRGNNLKNSIFIDDDFVFISEELANRLSASSARRLDIILTHRGTIGQVAIIPLNSRFSRYIVSQSQMKFTVDQTKCDPYFVYYYLRSEYGMSQFLSNASQTGVPAIASPTNTLKSIKIPIPPMDEQKAIAKILSDLDAKIELNQKMNKTLEAIARAIFKHWFVDFEFPNEEGKPYKSSGGEMVDSELGEIPKGWEIKTLSQIADLKIGRTPPTNQKQWFSVNEMDIPWISIKDLGNASTFVLDTAKFLTQVAVDKFNIPIIQCGTVVLSFKLTVGRVAITGMDSVSNEAIAQFKIHDGSFITPYLYLYLKHYDYNNIGSTSSIANATNSKEIGKIPIIIPKYEILSQAISRFELIFEKIKVNSVEDKNIVKIRDSLLPKLMSGKIRVPLEE